MGSETREWGIMRHVLTEIGRAVCSKSFLLAAVGAATALQSREQVLDFLHGKT